MRSIPRHIHFLFRAYLCGLVVFTAFRVVLLTVNADATEGAPLLTFLESFLMGLRFDVVVSGYLIALPLIVLSIAESFGFESTWIARSVAIYIAVTFCLAFLICAADIPYFEHYHSRITNESLAWSDTPGFMLLMIAEDSHYYPFIALLAVVCVVYAYAVWRLERKWMENHSGSTDASKRKERFRIAVASAVALAATLVGIRGRLAAKSPIRWGTAYFSSIPFANQLALNPVFTLARSYLDARSGETSHLALMNDQEAVDAVREYLRIPIDSLLRSPIARHVEPIAAPRRANVVIVLMESLGAYRMGFCGSPWQSTPCLDTIARRAVVFDNLYSAGIHTFNGIYSTLFSFPALGARHPMKSTGAMQPFTGIARTLADNGYHTAFVTTHDDQFDNMGGFLRANGFQRIVEQDDYPADRVLSALGVPDHVMFETAVTTLNELHRTGSPFLATLLTSSFHGPYILPDDIPFHPRSTDLRQQVLEYADWSIGHFLDLCSQQPWFDSTIFVFVGDHGGTDRTTYAMSLDMNHTPALFYSPGLLPTPTRCHQPGGQIDLFPTIMGILNIPYVNNTLGIDLLRESRPYAYFEADDDIGVIGNEYFLAIPSHGRSYLYRYRNGDRTDVENENHGVADSMRHYAYAMLQTTEWIITHRMAGTEAGGR